MNDIKHIGTGKKPTRSGPAYEAGQKVGYVIAVVSGVAATLIIVSLAIWGLVSIWRGIIG